ncbi:MAG: hypothetical protein IPK74_30940 [Deltaproteobacteria bacterium]|nr:hypothetical protein [Deltaproteobacteria bacterium]
MELRGRRGPLVSLLLGLCVACGGDDAGAGGSESSSSTSGGPSATTGPLTTTSTGADASSDEGTQTDPDGSTGAPVDDPGVAPSCAACSLSLPSTIGVPKSQLLNPGRSAGETGDGRIIAATHDYDQAVFAGVLDPDTGTWTSSIELRDPGPWNEEQYTELRVVATEDGAVVLEHANGDLFAHRLAGEVWTHVELTDIPGFRYIADHELLADGRIAVLVRSNAAWDQPEQLTLAYFDVATELWEVDPFELVASPVGSADAAELIVDSGDGDIYVGYVTGPATGVYPRSGAVKRHDAATGEWTNLWGYEGYIFWISMRELEPAEVVFSPVTTTDIPEQTYFIAADGTLGPAIEMPYPQDYAGGTMRRVYFGNESEGGAAADTVNYHTYTREDVVGETDVLDVYGSTAAVDKWSARTLAIGGRGHALWSTAGGPPSLRVATHDDEHGWTDSIILGTPNAPIGPTQLAAHPNGDAFAAWSPTCNDGPCGASDPTVVAAYTAADHCWHTGTEVDGGADAYGYGFEALAGFVVTTVGNGYQARTLVCG